MFQNFLNKFLKPWKTPPKSTNLTSSRFISFNEFIQDGDKTRRWNIISRTSIHLRRAPVKDKEENDNDGRCCLGCTLAFYAHQPVGSKLVDSSCECHLISSSIAMATGRRWRPLCFHFGRSIKRGLNRWNMIRPIMQISCIFWLIFFFTKLESVSRRKIGKCLKVLGCPPDVSSHVHLRPARLLNYLRNCWSADWMSDEFNLKLATNNVDQLW